MSNLHPNPNDPDWDKYQEKIDRGDYSDINLNAWISRDGEPPVPKCWYRNPGGVGELVHHNELYKCTLCEVIKHPAYLAGFTYVSKFKESIYPKYNGCYKCTEDPFEVRKITPEEAGQNCCSFCTTYGDMYISNAEAVWVDKCTQMGGGTIDDKYECTENCDCASIDGGCWEFTPEDSLNIGLPPAEPCHECYAIPNPTGGKPFYYKKDLCKEGKDGKKISNHYCYEDACHCSLYPSDCAAAFSVIYGPTAAKPDDAGCWCGCGLWEDNPDDPCGVDPGVGNPAPDFNALKCTCECKLGQRKNPCKEGYTFSSSLCKCEKDYEAESLNITLIP